jgi:hypothetical protein
MSTDFLAELAEARLACIAADRELSKLEPTDPGRKAAEADLERGRERYARAVQAYEQSRQGQ